MASERRTKIVRVVLTDEEHRALVSAAKKAALSLAAYVRTKSVEAARAAKG